MREPSEAIDTFAAICAEIMRPLSPHSWTIAFAEINQHILRREHGEYALHSSTDRMAQVHME
jgi:hypothetical protein